MVLDNDDKLRCTQGDEAEGELKDDRRRDLRASGTVARVIEHNPGNASAYDFRDGWCNTFASINMIFIGGLRCPPPKILINSYNVLQSPSLEI